MPRQKLSPYSICVSVSVEDWKKLSSVYSKLGINVDQQLRNELQTHLNKLVASRLQLIATLSQTGTQDT